MDYYNKSELIKEKLLRGGYPELSAALSEVQISWGTAGELFAGIAYTVNKIKNQHPLAYKLANEEIDEIIQYAKSIDYL